MAHLAQRVRMNDEWGEGTCVVSAVSAVRVS
jgi:hypothetical protein